MARQDTRRDGTTALTDGSWKRFLEVYDIGSSVLGSGASSVVCKITKRSTGIEYAGKFTIQQEAHKELRALQALQRYDGLRIDSSSSSDSILTYHDAFNDDSGHYTCIVSDLMKGPTLLAALHDRGSYSEEDARAIMRQILEALVNIHESGMVHRDIKLNNVLLPSAECHTSIKIADFGFAAPWSESEPKLKQRCGTPLFISPEQAGLSRDLSSECEYDNKVDVWAAGVILFMLLSGYPPFWGRNIPDLLHSIAKKNPRFGDPAWELVSPEAKDLVLHMLAKEPSSRLSAKEALRHPWILEDY